MDNAVVRSTGLVAGVAQSAGGEAAWGLAISRTGARDVASGSGEDGQRVIVGYDNRRPGNARNRHQHLTAIGLREVSTT